MGILSRGWFPAAAEEDDVGRTPRAPQRRQEDPQLLLPDVVLRAEDHVSQANPPPCSLRCIRRSRACTDCEGELWAHLSDVFATQQSSISHREVQMGGSERGGCRMRLGVARPLRSARNSRSVSSLTRTVQLHNLDVPILTGAQKDPVGFLLYPPHLKNQIFTVL